MHSDFSFYFSKLFVFAYFFFIHYQFFRTHISYSHNTNCQDNYELLTKKKIVADSNIYQSTRYVFNSAAFADFSIIFSTNEIVFNAFNAEKFSIAMRHDETNEHELFVKIVSKL